MRNTTSFLSALALVLTAATGCNTGGGTGSDPPEDTECHDATKAGCVVVSEEQRIQSPDVPSADASALVSGNTNFAFELYQQLSSEPGNLFYSPYSISAALAMTWAGARGQTETDMAATLDFKLPQAQLHPAFNQLDQALMSRGKDAKGSDGQPFRLRVANALWGQINYPFEQPFLDVLGENYGAGMHVVDFEGNTSKAIDLINTWVDTNTEGKIKELVNEMSVDTSTRLVLTNAIYFNASWAEPFEPKNTQDGAFHKLDGTDVTVPLMHGFQETAYVDADGYQALVLPYDGRELSMVIVLPDAGTFTDFEASLDGKIIDDAIGAAQTYSVDITMPKFKFDADFSLKDTLSKMGMDIAFSGLADFSGISSTGSLVIKDVIHKSFVSVNEAGTEAAAATAVIVGETSAPEPATMTIDRPFLFVIRDNATESILFVGRVVDPA
jgi:serpin B